MKKLLIIVFCKIVFINITFSQGWNGRDNNILFPITTNNNIHEIKVGVGTRDPSTKIHIRSITPNQFSEHVLRIQDGSQGNGRFLQSDAQGNAKWADLPNFGHNVYKFTNGLTLRGDTVLLGGELTENTHIELNSYTLSTAGDGEIDFEVTFNNDLNTKFYSSGNLFGFGFSGIGLFSNRQSNNRSGRFAILDDGNGNSAFDIGTSDDNSEEGPFVQIVGSIDGTSTLNMETVNNNAQLSLMRFQTINNGTGISVLSNSVISNGNTASQVNDIISNASGDATYFVNVENFGGRNSVLSLSSRSPNSTNNNSTYIHLEVVGSNVDESMRLNTDGVVIGRISEVNDSSSYEEAYILPWSRGEIGQILMMRDNNRVQWVDLPCDCSDSTSRSFNNIDELQRLESEVYELKNLLINIQNKMNLLEKNQIDVNKTDFIIFPNPTNDLLNIKFSSNSILNISFEITSSNGKIVQNFKPNDFEFRLNVSSYLSGTYYISMYDNGKLIESKIFIKH